MRTRRVLVCETCEQTILRGEDGFVVHGAVLPADPEATEALAGQVIPLASGSVQVKSLATEAYCRRCFSARLGLTGVVAPAGAGVFQAPSVQAAAVPTVPAASVQVPAVPVGVGVQVTSPVTQVGAGAFVMSGVSVPAGDAEQMPAVAKPVVVGSTVRLNQRHAGYSSLRGRSATVERFLEDQQAFVVRFADGSPAVARSIELDNLG